MGRAYKNFWSLNIDEAIVTGILRDKNRKNFEVFMPLNAQMNEIDLICINLRNKKIVTIQVKGSKAYEPEKERKRVQRKVQKIGGDTSDGSSGWFFLKGGEILRSTADYYVFLISIIAKDYKIGRRTIEPHIIVIPTKELQRLVKKYKNLHGGRYSFYFWINPRKKVAFDWRDKPYLVSKYLNGEGINRLTALLK